MKTIANDYGLDETALTSRLTALHADYDRWQQQYEQLDYSFNYRQGEAIHRQLRDLVNTLQVSGELLLDYLDEDLKNLPAMLPRVTAKWEAMRQPGGRPVNFPCKRLVARLVMFYQQNSRDENRQTKARQAAFVTAVFKLWGLPCWGASNVITELRRKTPPK